MSIFTRTLKWFQTAGQIAEPPVYTPRQVAFYLGMQCEELAEKLDVIDIIGNGTSTAANQLAILGTALKNGEYDERIARLSPAERWQLLDGDMDLIWVTIGSLAAQGVDADGAWNEVSRANWDKFPGGVVTRHPVTGKVIKPEGWREPNLLPFVGGAK
jgi:predicted HAD superfamily Cof-like phosphohydrolase